MRGRTKARIEVETAMGEVCTEETWHHGGKAKLVEVKEIATSAIFFVKKAKSSTL